MITIIAAVGNNNELGKGADLLWHLPNDFKHFKALTTGHCIIMGRKTFETFKKPLPNRKHIVVTRQADYYKEGAIVVHSLEEGIALALHTDPDPYIIGGGEIYAQALPLANRIVLTRVHYHFAEADVFFPEIDYKKWKLVEVEHFKADEKHAYDYSIEYLVLND